MAEQAEPISFRLEDVIPAFGDTSYSMYLNPGHKQMVSPVSYDLSPEPDAADVRQGVAFGFAGEMVGTLQAGGGKPAQVGGAGRVY